MSEVIQLSPTLDKSVAQFRARDIPPVRTEGVNVVFTTADETLRALRVASFLGKAMAVPLTLVHCRAVPYPLPLDGPAGMSPVETDEFVERARSEGIDLRIRVYLCRNEERALPTAFRRHSVVVIAGRRSWWPTASERLRRRLEAAGHFVLFVDTAGHKEISRA